MKIRIEGFIQKGKYSKDLQFCAADMSEYGYLTVGVVDMEIDFEIPADFNPVAVEIAAIEKKMDSMADEYHGKVAQLKERIANLLCLENSPAAPAFNFEDEPF